MNTNDDFDEVAQYNKQQWEQLAGAGVEYARPMLDLDADAARSMLDPYSMIDRYLGDVPGRDVLCLAAGGGQQSVAFALLGANVTVFDLSETQLVQDRLAAEHYGVHIDVVQGDMRDLRAFDEDSFDIVYQAYSINFVPHVPPVHAEVARTLRSNGLYRLDWHNPFTQAIDDESWTGEGYLLSHFYEDGRDMTEFFPHWDVTGPDGRVTKIASPHEYVHALSTMINSLVAQGFVLIHASEDAGSEAQPEPGSWPHFMRVTAPYLTLWSQLRPKVFLPLPAAKG